MLWQPFYDMDIIIGGVLLSRSGLRKHQYAPLPFHLQGPCWRGRKYGLLSPRIKDKFSIDDPTATTDAAALYDVELDMDSAAAAHALCIRCLSTIQDGLKHLSVRYSFQLVELMSLQIIVLR